MGDGTLASDIKLRGNKFNEIVINVVPVQKIPTPNIMLIDYIKNKAIFRLYLGHVNETEIKKLISSLRSNIPGYDMISIAELKRYVNFIFEPLSYECNMPLQDYFLLVFFAMDHKFPSEYGCV